MDPVLYRLLPVENFDQQFHEQDANPLMCDATPAVSKLDTQRIEDHRALFLEQHTVEPVVNFKEWNEPSAYHLADLDFLFTLTGYSLYEQKVSPLPLLFLDIGCGSPGFAEYIQSRCTFARGFGVYRMGDTVNWDPNILKYNRMDLLAGDVEGNIELGYEEVIDTLTDREPEGVHLVTIGSTSSMRELVVAFFTGLSVMMVNGNLVMVLPDINNKMIVQLCKLASTCFSRWTLLKTVVSGTDSSCYFVGLGKGDVHDVLHMLEALITQQWIAGYDVISMMDETDAIFNEHMQKLYHSIGNQVELLGSKSVNWNLLRVIYDI